MTKPIHILHANPLSSDRSLVQQALEAEPGCQVIEANSCEEVLACLEEQKYDLVLSDCHLPGGEGIAFLETIKGKHPSLPVVVLIASDAEELGIAALERGAADYVLKTPHYLRRLPYTIRAVLVNTHLQDERIRAEKILQEYAERLEVVSKLDHLVDEELRQYANRLKILHEIYQSILEARSPQEVAEAALRHLRRLMPCQYALVAAFDFDAAEATILAAYVAGKLRLKAGMRLPLDIFGSPAALQQGQVRVVDDIFILPRPTPNEQALTAENIRAYLEIPLMTQNRVIGSLKLGAKTPYAFNAERVEIAREVADQVALAVQQARLYEQVQRHAAELEQRVAERTAELRLAQVKSERAAQELRQLIETANAPIFGIDATGRINEWNQTAAKITDYRKEEVLGRELIAGFIPAARQTAVKAVLEQALAGIETANFELLLRTKQGQRITVLLNASTRRDTAGNIIGVVGVGQDITERRRAEEALSWEAGVNAAMADLSKALLTLASIHDISYLVLECAKRFTGSKLGFVGYIDPQTGYLVSTTMTRDVWELCQVSEKSMIFEEFTGLWGWVLTERQALLTNYAAQDYRSGGIPGGHLPIHRFLSAPALIGEAVVGQIALANADRDYTGRDLALVERLAGLYALAVERKRIEKELRQLSVAVEQTATVIMITDLDGQIVFVNHAFEKSTGYAKAELLGQSPRILKTEFLSPEMSAQLWHTISTGGVWSGEFFNQRKDGRTYWESAVITPITNEQGEIMNYIAVKEDITQRKAAEAALKNAKEAAEAANRLKSEFLANMSHEIRTPMNAILGFAELLYEEESDPAKREKLEIIKRSGKHLLDLINDILDFSKIEAGRIEIEPKQFTLKRMLADIQSQFLVKAAEQQLTLTIAVDAALPQIVYGDEYRINQIVLNILSNAFEFTEKGGITVHCSYQQGVATISVTDTGVGIPPEKHTIIFSPFEQADSSIARQHGGAGLGLAITKRLAELMGGRIRMESEVGVGSTFTVELPLPAVPAAPLDDAPVLPAPPPEPAAELNGEQLVQAWRQGMQGNPALEHILFEAISQLPEKVRALDDAILRNVPADIKFITHTLKGVAGNLGMQEIYARTLEIERLMQPETPKRDELKAAFAALQKIVASIPAPYFAKIARESKAIGDLTAPFQILLAEDNEVNQMLIQEILEGMALRCDLAENGQIALDKLKRQKYDLLLLDMQMPVMDGMEAIRHIRADAALKDLYVIALTAHAMKGDAEKYTRLGCNDYLPKPIRIEQFRERIHHVLLKGVFRPDPPAQPEGAEHPAVAQPPAPISPAQRQGLQAMIAGLQANCEIFNPQQIAALADQLVEFTFIKDVHRLKEKLLAAADTFDDQAIAPIIKRLEEIQSELD